MHKAPAVSYPVGRSQLQAGVYLGVWLLGACAGMIWGLQSGRLAWGLWLFLAIWLLAAFVLLREFRRTQHGILSWDGQQWHWASDRQERLGQTYMRLDLQSRCLVEFRPESGGALWLWPQRCADTLNWTALRRALSVSSARDSGFPRPSSVPTKGQH